MILRKLGIALAVAVAFASSAFAQSGCPSLMTGAVLTAAQWNACFSAKNDNLGFTPLNVAGGTMSGRLVTAAPGATLSGFNLTPGTAPGSPVNGDTWTTTAGFFARINGATYNLISPASTCPLCAMTNAANNFGQVQTVDIGSGAAPAFDTGTILGLNGANGVVNRVELTAFGAAPVYSTRYGGGTRASPTAPTSATLLGSINAHAYDGSTWTGSPGAALHFYADGSTWTASSHPGEACLATTPNGSSAGPTDVLCVRQDAGVVLGVPTGGDKGAATFNAAGLIYSNGNALAASATSPLALNATTGVLTCPTCVTSSGGGAITGTSPVVVSAAGLVSVQGGGGQILQGQGGTGSVFTSGPQLGTPGAALGTLAFANLTSGLITVSPPTGALGTVTNSLQAVTDTFVYRATADTLTNKTLTSPVINVGSDATGDIYYRNAGALTRLGVGSNGNVLQVNSGLPSWQAGSSAGSITQGSTTIGGTCPNGQILFSSSATLGCENLASTVTAGSGISITGTTNPTIKLALNSATLDANPADPTLTSSATGVMMGLGSTCTITPVYSTRVKVTFDYNMANPGANRATVIGKFGTGAAPTNGTAFTGTTFGATAGRQAAVGAAFSPIPGSNAAIITGLTPSTAYWLDLDVASSASNTTVSAVHCTAEEF